LDAYAHQDLPFEKLVEELHPERDLSRNPLFQVMFALQNASTFAPQLSGLMVIPMEIENTRTRFDLEVHLSETSEGLKGAFVCNTDLFDAATIERMAGHYQRMLEGIAANPDQRLSELPLLTEAEQHKLLREWNDTSTEYPKDLCIHELFEKQAERTPDAIAVIFGDRQLTYRELNSRANQLGNYLRKQGVGAEVLVGICVERSMEMVIGILGILKAGGAYVPLDPAYPEERLNFMIEDTRTPVILTQRELLEVLPGHAAKTICLDSDWKMIARESKGKPASGTTAGSLAYVMYTSGSTGRPKGVCVLHRAVIRLVLNTNYMKLEPSDIVAQASSFSFDASVLEIWGALLTGARLVGIDKEIVLSPRDLASQILKQRVSVLFLTTALFNHVAREAPASFRSVKNLLFGGEAADPRCAEMVMKAGPPGRLLNLYGPTESTVVTTWYRVEYIPGDATTIPIGKPVSNTTVYVLDNNLHPVPTGVPGELYVGGDALARGYLNRPEMTAEKFIPDPFSEEPGARLYKTGDMVRYLPDGNIEFLGRTDHQVKLRGFRIELEEIKAVLGQHPDVRETVVITRGDQPGEKRLVAYVVMNRTSNTTTDQLREFLREKLPDYMVPSSFVVLDSLPLTPNGKIDWTALPAANRFIPGPGKNFLAPRNALELQLAGIWEKILGVKPVGVRDNFFELGGHSLLAGRLVAEINRMTGQNLPLIAIFQSPTVEQLCEMFAGEDRSGQLSSLVPIQTAGTKQPFYWVCSGTSVLWRYFDADQPLYVLLDQGLDGKPVRHTTVEEIAAHYLKEIRTVQPEGPYSLGGYSFGGIAALEIAQKLCREGEEVSLLFLIEPPENSFPLAKPGNASSSGNDSFHSRLNYHKKNLALLPPGDRIVYILSKLSSVLDWIKARTWIPAERKIKMAICKISLFVGHPIPLSLRNPYLMDIYKKALRGYTPQVYPGKVVLCHSDKVRYSSQSELKCVAAGGVDVFKVQGAGHLEIVKEPYAEKCARHLKEWLNEVQAKKEDRQV
jgi:aspartate racemase